MAQGPLLALVVSGGHTHLYLAEAKPLKIGAHVAPQLRYKNVGRTVDDAAGEAFDKVAKLLGLGYPGGPWMDALAAHGNPRAVEFRFQPIKRRERMTSNPNPTHGDATAVNGAPDVVDGANFDFSFSGIKTAILRYTQTHAMQDRIEGRRTRLAAALHADPALKPADALRALPELFDQQTLDLIASFQFAVVGNLLKQTFAAAEAHGARVIIVSGGVSANSELRRRFTEEAARRGLRVDFPSLALSTDNAAMIAAAAWPKFRAGQFADDGLVATPQLRLG